MDKPDYSLFDFSIGNGQAGLQFIRLFQEVHFVHRGSYISAHVLLNLSNELGKGDKMLGLPSIISLFATNLLNSIKQEPKC